MLLTDFKAKSKLLIKLWLVLFGIQLLFFTVSSIAVSVIEAPKYTSWIWDYLTLTKSNTKLAKAWLVCNLFITCIDFYAIHRVSRENRLVLQKANSSKEGAIMRKMYRNLKFSIVFILLAFFMQMMHGVIWWLTCLLALTCKICFFRELNYLDPGCFSLKTPKRDW